MTQPPTALPTYTLLMTACIDPSTGPASVVRADPQTRLADYHQALHYWLHYPDPRLNKILFVENSGYPLATLQALAGTANPRHIDVEFISLNTNNFSVGPHYGYGEFQMIDLALDHSRLLAQSSHFIKVTGRLRFPSLSRLLNKLPPDFKLAVDARNNKHFVPCLQQFITTQIMLFDRAFYTTRFRKTYRDMTRLGHRYYMIENLFYDRMIPLRGQPGVLLRFPCNANPVGIAAHLHKSYSSPRQRLISTLRAATRLLAPNWWL